MAVATVRERVAIARDRIQRAAEAAGRSPDDVRILAQADRKSHYLVREAALAGVDCFGVGDPEEMSDMARDHRSLEWHVTGSLALADVTVSALRAAMVQTVDSVWLATALDRASLKTLPVLLQVRVDGLLRGCRPGEVQGLARYVTERCPGLALRGLMMGIPRGGDPAPLYARLRALRDETEQALGVGLPELSMGGSGDLEEAVTHGATVVRLRAAVFGL